MMGIQNLVSSPKHLGQTHRRAWQLSRHVSTGKPSYPQTGPWSAQGQRGATTPAGNHQSKQSPQEGQARRSQPPPNRGHAGMGVAHLLGIVLHLQAIPSLFAFSLLRDRKLGSGMAQGRSTPCSRPAPQLPPPAGARLTGPEPWGLGPHSGRALGQHRLSGPHSEAALLPPGPRREKVPRAAQPSL